MICDDFVATYIKWNSEFFEGSSSKWLDKNVSYMIKF